LITLYHDKLKLINSTLRKNQSCLVLIGSSVRNSLADYYLHLQLTHSIVFALQVRLSGLSAAWLFLVPSAVSPIALSSMILVLLA